MMYVGQGLAATCLLSLLWLVLPSCFRVHKSSLLPEFLPLGAISQGPSAPPLQPLTWVVV